LAIHSMVCRIGHCRLESAHLFFSHILDLLSSVSLSVEARFQDFPRTVSQWGGYLHGSVKRFHVLEDIGHEWRLELYSIVARCRLVEKRGLR